MMIQKLMIMALCVSFLGTAFCNDNQPQKLNLSLLFSTDDGQTYDSAFPVCEQGGIVYVKLEWQVNDPQLKVKDNVAMTRIESAGTDFASANIGEQKWNGRKAWYQRIKKYYFNANKPGAMVYVLDLGKRDASVVNKSEDESKERSLPACAALTPGDYQFDFLVGYHLEKPRKYILQRLPFTVSVTPKGKRVAQKISPSKKKNEKSPKKLNVDNTACVQAQNDLLKRSDYLFPIDKCHVLAGNKEIEKRNDLIQPRQNELGWKIKNVEAGKYFIRLLIMSGISTGEEELKAIPFVFLNGKAIAFNRASPLVFRKRYFTTVIQSAHPVEIKNGDVVRWNQKRNSKFGALALAKKKMKCTPIWVSSNKDPDINDYFRVQGEFSLPENASGEGAFKLAITNVTGSESKAVVECRILDYFQKTLAKERKEIILNNRARLEQNISFDAGDSDRYRAIVSVVSEKGLKNEAVFTILASKNGTYRKKIWLSEKWFWTSIPDDGTLATRRLQGMNFYPKDGKWANVDLPAAWKDKASLKNHHIAWYEKKFVVPEWFKNERYVLNFSRVAYACNIFLNGQKVSGYTPYFAPFTIDVTSALKIGVENVLSVEVLDEVGALTEAEVRKPRPEVSRAGELKGPLGLRSGVGEVFLTSTPKCVVDDVFVKTSFQKKRIDLVLSFKNISPDSKYTVENRVLLEGENLLTFEARNVKTDQEKLTVGKVWEKPVLWGPTEFPLLELDSLLKDENGKVIDQKRTRFGFREFWAEGMNFKWNGEVVKFASRPFLSMWGSELTRRNKRDNIRNTVRKAKRFECNMLRHIYNSRNYADIADEEGIVFAQGVMSLAHHTKQQLDSERFWENVAKTAIEVVEQLKNHPSIVEWYLSNEYYGESEKRNGERLKAYGEEVLKVDDTRLIEFGCDLDLRGYNKLISTHYPVDVMAFRMEDTYLPEAVYWRRFNQSFEKGMKVPAGMCQRVANVLGEKPITWGYKPILVNETCWDFFFDLPDGMTRIGCDWVYEGQNAVTKVHGMISALFDRGHRDANVSAITMWLQIHGHPVWETHPKVDINILECYNKFFSGEKIEYNVNLNYDIFKARDLTFLWSLKDQEKVVDSEKKELTFNSCELKREKIVLTMPEVDIGKKLSLILQLNDGDKIVKEALFSINVYPKDNLKKFSFVTGLFKVAENDKNVLNKFLVNSKEIADLSSLNAEKISLLIIGKGLREKELEPYKDELNSFTENGGTILLLRQNYTQEWLPVSLRLTSRVPAINYTFRPEHPLLRGIEENELSYWYPTHKTGEKYYLKPIIGNTKTVVEAGGPGGLIFSGLLEIPYGNGRFICSQLSLLDGVEKNPIAVKLLNNIFILAETKKNEWTKVAYLGRASSETLNALKRMNAEMFIQKDTKSLAKFDWVFWDVEFELGNDQMEDLKTFLSSGGNIWVKNVTPDTQGQVSKILNQKVVTYPIKAVAWLGRAIRAESSSITKGITNYDLFWRARPEIANNQASTFYSTRTVLAPLGEYVIFVSDAVAPFYPALLQIVAKGKGKVVIDNVNWSCNKQSVKKNATRIASTLLTNIGVKVKGMRTIKVPENLAYSEVDISKLLNRSFSDDVDNDGKGGWSDQGPECDLRSFPMDKSIQVFNNVPFRIEKGKSCLVLNSKYRPGAPESVVIPVDKKADVLFFLQSSAWTSSKHHASYFVNYDDGSKYEIKLIGGVNLRDWAVKDGVKPFLNELDTITKVGWSGRNKKLGYSNLYNMAWLNPYPEKAVKTIVFRSKNIGVPILVALTTGIKQEIKRKPKATPEQVSKAKELVNQGDAEKKSGKLEKAKALYNQAIETAWNYAPSYLAMGYVLEEEGQYEKAISIYEKQLNVAPDELEGYMRIAKCWESLDRYDKAIETYRRSLKADVNQPDIMKALNKAKEKDEVRD